MSESKTEIAVIKRNMGSIDIRLHRVGLRMTGFMSSAAQGEALDERLHHE